MAFRFFGVGNSPDTRATPQAWRGMHAFATRALPRPARRSPTCMSRLAQSVMRAMRRWRHARTQIEALAREGRYPSGSLVPAVSRGFAAFERGDFPAAIEALEPVADESERHRRQPRATRSGRVHAAEGVSRRGPAGRGAPDAARAAARPVRHPRLRVGEALTVSPPGAM